MLLIQYNDSYRNVQLKRKLLRFIRNRVIFHYLIQRFIVHIQKQVVTVKIEPTCK